MWYISRMEYYSARKKNEILPFATTWRDLEYIIMLSEISQTEKDKYCVITYMWNKVSLISKKYNKLVNIAKQKQTHSYRKQTSGHQWGEGRGRGKIGVGIKRYKLLAIK